MIYQRRLGNDLSTILGVLEPYRARIQGLAVESTYDWYWLVDGLMEAGYQVHLVQMRTTHILSVQTLITRNTGRSLNGNKIKKLQPDEVLALLPCEENALAVNGNLSVMQTLQEQIKLLAQAIEKRAKLNKTNRVVAIKTVAHKLARACYYILRDQVESAPLPPEKGR